MYAVTYSEENEGYRCFQPDPGIGTAALGACEAAAIGASASALSGTGETALSAPVRGQGHERYFLLVVDDYSRYTTVLPLRSKGAVTEVLIDWIREARLQLRKSFGSGFPVLRLHSDRGGEFSSRLLRDYCRARGIRQTFTLPDSPQQNGIAERRIGMVMDVARTSMMHAAAPHFLWPFAVRYAAHQLNLHPRVSRPAMSPALLWTGKVGDASVFRVWGSRAFVRDLSADKLSPRAAPCVFLGFPTDAPGWQFYHPSSRRVLSSQDVTFDESVPFYRLFPYRTPSLPPPPDFLVPVPPPVDPLPPQVPAPSGVSQVDAVDPVEVTGDSGAAAGAEPGGADSGGAVRGGAEPGGATAGGAGPEGATAEGAEPGGAEPEGAVPGGAGSGGAGSGAAEPVGAELGAAEPGGAVSGAAEPGVSPAAASRREPSLHRSCASGSLAAGGVLLSLEVLLELELELLRPSRVRVLPVPELLDLRVLLELELLRALVLSLLLLVLPLEVWWRCPTGGLAERREPASRPASPIRAARASGRSSRQRPPPVPGTHRMSLRPSTAPLRAPLPSPPESSLPALADPESDSLRAASPTVTRLLATVVTDPYFESTAASALVAELVDFAARCRLDYAASLVAESASVCPPSVGGECALGTDVLEDRQEELQCLAAASPHLASVLLAPEGDPDALDIPTPRSYAEALEGPYSSQWQAAMDAEMASWKSTGTYVDAVPPPGANIVSGMWIFRVKRPPGSPPVFKARTSGMGLVLGGRSPVVLTGHADASWADDQATQRSSQGYTFSLGSGSVSWRSTRSSSVLGSSCEAEIYAGAMAAQELRWLTYLLTDLGEPPRSPPVLYVDNKAMLALCREQRLEHRTKHIALRYFLARELQQRGQLRLAYVASEANTADVFTKALAPCDHQRFCTQLGLVPVLPHLLSF
ncbi:unnamed protein product [Closterium sp. NIES-64]|nr:unnamed protein product [Closterium sp. NIES-64]